MFRATTCPSNTTVTILKSYKSVKVFNVDKYIKIIDLDVGEVKYNMFEHNNVLLVLNYDASYDFAYNGIIEIINPDHAYLEISADSIIVFVKHNEKNEAIRIDSKHGCSLYIKDGKSVLTYNC